MIDDKNNNKQLMMDHVQNIRNNIKSFDLNNYWTDAPIALLQAGGIRTNMNSINKRGKLHIETK